MKHFLSKCDQIHSFLRFRKHLLKKSLMENFVFLALEFELVTGKKVSPHLCLYDIFRLFFHTIFNIYVMIKVTIGEVVMIV